MARGQMRSCAFVSARKKRSIKRAISPGHKVPFKNKCIEMQRSGEDNENGVWATGVRSGARMREVWDLPCETVVLLL